MTREEMKEEDFADPLDWVYEVRRRISEEYGYDVRRIAEAVGRRSPDTSSSGIRYVRLPIVRRTVTSV